MCSSELSTSKRWWNDCIHRFDFLGRIGSQIGLGRLNISVTQPKRDLTDISSCLQDQHRCGVPKDMW
jgi:hypothetical protein